MTLPDYLNSWLKSGQLKVGAKMRTPLQATPTVAAPASLHSAGHDACSTQRKRSKTWAFERGPLHFALQSLCVHPKPSSHEMHR